MAAQATNKKKPLGKGLSALLGPDMTGQSEDSVKTVRTESIHVSKYQARTRFSEEELVELSNSIQEIGILQPLVVRADGDNYELIAGERRLRAAKMLGHTEVPVIIKSFNDQQAFEASLIENIQRENLSPIEEAIGYKQFIDEFGYKQEDLSRLVGKSRSYIANTLRLLNLPEKIQAYVHDGRLSAGHARALLASDSPDTLVKDILDNNLNVRQAEAKTKKTASKQTSDSNLDDDILGLQTQLSSVLKSQVEIKLNGHKGVIEVKFTSLEQLDDLITKLCGSQTGLS